MLERSRRVDVGGVLPVVRRRLADQGMFARRDRDEIARLYERGQVRHHFCRGRDDVLGRLVGEHLLEARLDRLARIELGTFGFGHRLVAGKVVAPDRHQLVERDVDRLGRLQHLAELVGAEREVLRRAALLGAQPVGDPAHSLRSLGGGQLEALLDLGRLDVGKRLQRILRVVVGKSIERGDAVFDETRRHRRLEVGADFLRAARHLVEELGQRLHARRLVGVVAADVDVGVERTGVECRVGVRLVSFLEEE